MSLSPAQGVAARCTRTSLSALANRARWRPRSLARRRPRVRWPCMAIKIGPEGACVAPFGSLRDTVLISLSAIIG